LNADWKLEQHEDDNSLLSTPNLHGFFIENFQRIIVEVLQALYGPVHLAYNPSYSACFFSRNSIFLSQKISQQCFSAGL
jgi:hypothetical protein